MLDQLNVTNERPLVQLAAEVGVIEKLKKRIPNRLKESPSRFPASEIGASSNFRARITPLGHRHLPGFVHGERDGERAVSTSAFAFERCSPIIFSKMVEGSACIG